MARTIVDLSGTWKAVEVHDDLAKRFATVHFDDSSWGDITVPGHWRSAPELASSDGPVLHRVEFTAPAPDPGRRAFLELEGVFYLADVWLDGDYIDATEGYFTKHAFEVTDVLRARTDHVLGIEVACPPQRDRTAKRTVTGVFSHWDCIDPAWNPGGIWRPVRVVETGAARFTRCRVLCIEAAASRGRLELDASIHVAIPDDTSAPPVRLSIDVHGPDGALLAQHADELSLASGDNHISVELSVEDPPKWWPWRLGEQPLCEVAAALTIDGELSDGHSVRTAFREVRVEDWVFTVNGERMFVMGSNIGPTRPGLADVTAAQLTDDLRLARDANIDLVRVHAHVSRDELYDSADELGVLLWQDMPLQWAYSHGVRKQAVRQAREMVDRLGHHPSIAAWCAHNAPVGVRDPSKIARYLTLMAAPTWNKDVLDRTVQRALKRADHTRVVIRHSGVLPGPTTTGTDSHLYFGWYYGKATDMATVLRHWPRLARFVSELGAQAAPCTADFMEPERWPDLDWPTLAEKHGLQGFGFDAHVPTDRFESFDEWRQATQEYQATLIQLQVEDLRRLRFSPTGGFCHYLLADAEPMVSWSVLDHERRPKLGYAALRDACRPILPVVDPRSGAVHVVNEERRALHNATLHADVDGRTWRLEGNVGADAVTHVGTIDVAGARTVTVELHHPSVGAIENRYSKSLLDLARVDSVGIPRPQ